MQQELKKNQFCMDLEVVDLEPGPAQISNSKPHMIEAYNLPQIIFMLHVHIPNSKVCKRIVGCVMCKYKLAQLHCLPLDLYILPGIH